MRVSVLLPEATIKALDDRAESLGYSHREPFLRDILQGALEVGREGRLEIINRKVDLLLDRDGT